MTDAKGRPFFLWDVDVTLDRFRELLRHLNRGTRVHALAKLLRQAKPDDEASVDSLASEERGDLERFRDELVARLTRAAAPG